MKRQNNLKDYAYVTEYSEALNKHNKKALLNKRLSYLAVGVLMGMVSIFVSLVH